MKEHKSTIDSDATRSHFGVGRYEGMKTIIIILFIAAFSARVLWSGGRLPIPFRSRSCQGKGWRRAFPDTSKVEIRKFLSLFVQAFAFSEGERLKLRPQDLLLDVYRALYPQRWQADAMELETLAEEVDREYGLNLERLWNEQLTLGELFAACLAAQAKMTTNNGLDPTRQRGRAQPGR